MAAQTTRGIEVSVDPQYQENESKPESSFYFWTYTITLRNVGQEVVQLISRHWIISDATGKVEEVKGEGVVGQQPVLEPGESFTYTSGCPLTTPIGEMKGTYQMINEDGEEFDVVIPAFELIGPIVYH